MPEPTKAFTPSRFYGAGMLVLVLLLLVALCVIGADGLVRTPKAGSAGSGSRVYRSSTLGFRFQYPDSFREHDIVRNATMVIFKWFVVANPGTDPGEIAPSSRDLSALPASAAIFFVADEEGGPWISIDRPETHFPLRSTSFRPMHGVSIPEGASWLSRPLVANGWMLGADVYFGPKASSADRAAIWRIVSSLRFESLRTGQLTGNGQFLVLKKASSYPVGYIQRLDTKKLGVQAYLVRAPHGFYGISGLDTRFPNNLPCPMRFDRPGLEFACTNGPRRWNRMGRPLWRGAGFRDYLAVLIAVKVGQDGHVLFSSSEGAADRGRSALEKKYWG